MAIVLLVRHAENEYVKEHRLAGRIPGVHLNERGRVQADLLAEFLKGAPIKAVYSSPLERAQETVAKIAEQNRIAVITREELTEVDYGEWQGQSLKDLRKTALWKTVQQRPALTQFPYGETFASAQQRSCDWLTHECEQYKPKGIILCVSHCDLIKLIIGFFIGLPLDQFQRLNISTASISALRIIPGKNSDLLFLNVDVSSVMKKRQGLVY